MFRKAIVVLVTCLPATSICNSSDAQIPKVNEKGFNKSEVTLFAPSLEPANADALSKTMLSANKSRLNDINVRLSDKLERVVCCFNPENFWKADQVDCDQHILVWPGYRSPIKDKTLLGLIRSLPYDRTEFKKKSFDLDFETRGSNSFIPFHTMISNDETLRKCICQLTVQLPSLATADTVAVMSMQDDRSSQRVTLVVLCYENRRLEKDEDLKSVLAVSNVTIGSDFAFFVLCEPDLKHGGSKSKCLEFVEDFVESKQKETNRDK